MRRLSVALISALLFLPTISASAKVPPSDSCPAASNPSAFTSPHFRIEYGGSPFGQQLTIADFRDAFEHAWATQVNTLHWAAPPSKRYLVRIDQMMPRQGQVFGYSGVLDNPNTSWVERDAHSSCIHIVGDFDPLTTRVEALKQLNFVTEHEFQHAIQLGYGVLPSQFPSCNENYIEGGAEWMAEFTTSSNLAYEDEWPRFQDGLNKPRASPCADPPDSAYGWWLLFHGLAEQYSTTQQVIRDFWAAMSQADSVPANGVVTPADALGLAVAKADAIDKGLATPRPATEVLAEAMHAFGIAIRFLKACGSGVSRPYCLSDGAGILAAMGTPPGGFFATSETESDGVSHGGGGFASLSDYSVNWLGIPGDQGNIDITIRGSSGITSSAVCDKGLMLLITPLTSLRTVVDTTDCAELVVVSTDNRTTPLSSPTPGFLGMCWLTIPIVFSDYCT